MGYHSKIVLNGRIVNDSMGMYIADKAVKKMVEAGLAPKTADVVILGLTFKENCPDIRNSKVYDISKQLRTYGIEPRIVDPWADREDAYIEYGVKLYSINDIKNVDCIIVAVAHRQFVENRIENIENMFGEDQEHNKVLIDVKGIYDIENLKKSNIYWWRL